MNFALNTAIAAITISGCAFLASKNPKLAGFIIALPITSLLTLALHYGSYKDGVQSIEYSKSILMAIPFSLLFFVPFLLSKKLNLSFLQCYITGLIMLALGYMAYSKVFN